MLTVLTTSLNYADYLQETLPYMTAIADRVIVITGPDDDYTHEVCRVENVEAYSTRAFFRNGAVFAKGSAINEALRYYRRSLENRWLLHLDADMIVPERPKLDGLRKDCLYGAQRRAIVGAEGLAHFKKTGQVRFVRQRTIMKPIGFFQLWHSGEWRDYPSLSDNASWDDMEFIKLFQHRQMLQTPVYHLQTTDLRRRSNWDGRVTKLFH